MSCEHAWRTGPITDLLLRTRQAVCIKCFEVHRIGWEESLSWPEWTEADYWEHQEHVDPAAYAAAKKE